MGSAVSRPYLALQEGHRRLSVISALSTDDLGALYIYTGSRRFRRVISAQSRVWSRRNHACDLGAILHAASAHFACALQRNRRRLASLCVVTAERTSLCAAAAVVVVGSTV